MPDPGGRTGFAQKPASRSFTVKITTVDDLERHRTTKIGIKGLVGHAHRAAAQLNRHSIFTQQELIVIESVGPSWHRRSFRKRIISTDRGFRQVGLGIRTESSPQL